MLNVKKCAVGAITAACVLSLSGCGLVADVGLTDSELSEVAEYTAKAILKYDKAYTPDLADTLVVYDNPDVNSENFNTLDEAASDSSVTNTPTTPSESGTTSSTVQITTGVDDSASGSATGTYATDTTTTKAALTNGGNPDSNTDNTTSLSKVYGPDEFDVAYSGATMHDTYPENDSYFSLSANEGMKLYVVSFTIKNNDKRATRFTQDNEIKYNLTFDDVNFYKPSMTLLENDLQFIDVKIKAGGTTEAVLIFNVPKDVDRSNAKLTVTGNGKSYTINAAQ